MIRLALILALLASHAFAKDMVPTPPDDLPVGELEPFLAKHFLETGNDDASLAELQDNAEFRALVEKHGLWLFGGPTPGRLRSDGATIWIRTAFPFDVEIQVFDQDGGALAKSDSVKTGPQGDFTAELKVSGLAPDTGYSYNVTLNGEPQFEADALPILRTAPAPGSRSRFSVAFGGGARYVAHREFIWDTVARSKPLAFLWLGDNLYIDDPESRSRQRLYYYRRQLRPEYRRMGAAGVAAYSIWDDHDFATNDDEGGPLVETPAWRRPVWNVYRENWVNPGYGGGEALPGCWYDFSLGDVDFFMTDGRSYRTFKGVEKEDRTMLGPEQKAWLLEALGKSDASFKVIASGTLWTSHADKHGKDSWWGCPHERDEIFNYVAEKQIGGVVLLSADRHRTDIYEMKWKGDYPLYEFETSKLTNDHTHPTRKEALFSYNEGNFFGKLDFDFTLEDPQFTFSCIANDGTLIHDMKLSRSQLEPTQR